MAVEIAAGIGALKAAGDIVSGLIATRDLHKFNGELIRLQEQLLQAYSAMFALTQQRDSLQAELGELKRAQVRLEETQTEMKRYRLRDFGEGTFAYVLDPEMAQGEPEHYLCANCFAKSEKSILQHTTDGHYYCRSCKFGLQLGKKTSPRKGGFRSGGGDQGWMGA